MRDILRNSHVKTISFTSILLLIVNRNLEYSFLVALMGGFSECLHSHSAVFLTLDPLLNFLLSLLTSA